MKTSGWKRYGLIIYCFQTRGFCLFRSLSVPAHTFQPDSGHQTGKPGVPGGRGWRFPGGDGYLRRPGSGRRIHSLFQIRSRLPLFKKISKRNFENLKFKLLSVPVHISQPNCGRRTDKQAFPVCHGWRFPGDDGYCCRPESWRRIHSLFRSCLLFRRRNRRR